MSDVLLIKNIGRLVTMVPAAVREGVLGVIPNAALRVRDGKIVWHGPESELLKVHSREEIIDACNGVVMPGLIDCHTHVVHAGWRQNEFNLRSEGKTYREIAKEGGGIASTVRETRLASTDELYESASLRIKEAMSRGTTTIEIKTGYGLDETSEAKIVDVIKKLKSESQMNIVGTSLAAHIVPAEHSDRRGEYLKFVIEKMLPYANASGAISACDVFVEEGAFTIDEAREIGKAAKKLGLAIHLHVDQFSDVNGGILASELGALSADHLDFTSEDGMRALEAAGVVGVVLPGASFFAGHGKFPDVRKMIDNNMRVAIASDYNPGTNPSLDLFLSATIAVTQMGMTCDEALLGITKHAAAALGLKDAGIIANGTRADIIILDAPDEYFPLYRYGVNFLSRTIIGGDLVSNLSA